MSYIEFNRVGVTFSNGFEVFKELFAAFDKETVNVLTGPTGSGKTTFLKLVMGSVHPNHGEVTVEGVDIHKLRGEQLARFRRSVGYVPQSPLLLEQRTLFENVAFPLWAQGLRKKDLALRVMECLEILELDEIANLYPRNLSYGQQRKGALARAIANKPLLLLADEPTDNLDAEPAATVLSLLRSQIGEGGTVVFTAHDTFEPLPNDRVLQFNANQLIDLTGST